MTPWRMGCPARLGKRSDNEYPVGLALPSFHARVLLIDDIDTTMPAHEPAVLVTRPSRPETIADLHNTRLPLAACLPGNVREGSGRSRRRARSCQAAARGLVDRQGTRVDFITLLLERKDHAQVTGRPSFSAAGFLAMAFVIVGLAGIFSTYAAPVPLNRALIQEAALDQALATAAAPDGTTRLEALRPALGNSAAAVLSGPGTLPERVARERARIRAHFEQQAATIGTRLRLLIGVVTLAAAVFGLAILGVGRPGP